MSVFIRRIWRWLAALLSVIAPNVGIATHVFNESVITGAIARSVTILAFDSENRPYSLGSGVKLSQDKIITNCHVVYRANRIEIKSIKSHRITAKLVFADYKRDLCQLEPEGGILLSGPFVEARSTPLQVGEPIFSVGVNPDFATVISRGWVQSLRYMQGGKWIISNVKLMKGFSGGGQFDKDGRLVGINTMSIVGYGERAVALPVSWIYELGREAERNNEKRHVIVKLFDKAREQKEKEDWTGLLETANLWVKENKNDALAHYYKGVAQFKIGLLDSAAISFGTSIELEPELIEARHQLGAIYAERNQLDQAIQTYLEAILIDPYDVDALIKIGGLYIKKNEFVKAIRYLKNATVMDPGIVEGWIVLGEAYDKRKDYGASIGAYERALVIDADDSIALDGLATAYFNSGKYTEAIDYFSKSVAINPTNDAALHGLGLAYARAKQTKKAIETLRQALSINPKLYQAWIDLGVEYDLSGKQNDALFVYKKALQIYPDEPRALFNSAIIYARQGDKSAYRKVLARLKVVAPEKAEYLVQKVQIDPR